MPVGKHLYQLECDGFPLQSYMVHVQPEVRGLDIEVSKNTIKSGESIRFLMRLEPSVELTVILDCGIPLEPPKIRYVEQMSDSLALDIGNCTYPSPGQYNPSIIVSNRVNDDNLSIQIDVEPALSKFKVEIEDRSDANELSLVVVRASDKVPFEGDFLLTVFNSFNVKNYTRKERVQLLHSNNFTDQIYMNITTYGRQTLHVQGGVFPIIREAQAEFTIGTDVTVTPQVYLVNQMAFVRKDYVWIDVQWIDGVGFNIKIEFGQEKEILLRYEQLIKAVINRSVNKTEGQHQIQWKRLGQKHIQVGYK